MSRFRHCLKFKHSDFGALLYSYFIPTNLFQYSKFGALQLLALVSMLVKIDFRDCSNSKTWQYLFALKLPESGACVAFDV